MAQNNSGGNGGVLVVILLLLLIGGGAYGYYAGWFKGSGPAPATPGGTPQSASNGSGDPEPVASAGVSVAAAGDGCNPAPGQPYVTPGGFSYYGATELLPGTSENYHETGDLAPEIEFPMDTTPVYANSQFYNPGGYGWEANNPGTPDPGQYINANYSLPWRDIYCEKRGRDDIHINAYCDQSQGTTYKKNADGSYYKQGGKKVSIPTTGRWGHTGQDIRPTLKSNDTQWAVAAVDGRILYDDDPMTVTTKNGTKYYTIDSFMITVVSDADPASEYRYLHLERGSLIVANGAHVHAGDKLGRISNFFGMSGGKPQHNTTTHLHFEIRRVFGSGQAAVKKFIPIYMALVHAYERKTGDPGCPA